MTEICLKCYCQRGYSHGLYLKFTEVNLLLGSLMALPLFDIRTPEILVKEFGLCNKKIYTPQSFRGSNSNKRWLAPPTGVIKVNADASVSKDGWVGLGVVARDNEGRVLFAATRRSKAWWSPEIAEGKAL